MAQRSLVLFGPVMGVLLLSACVGNSLPPAGLMAYACHQGQAVHLLAFDPHPARRAWAHLGGGAKPGETPSQTALREFFEESNCAYPLDELRNTALLGPSIAQGTPFHSYSTQLTFKPSAEVAQSRPCGSVERNQWVWVAHAELVNAVMIDPPLPVPVIDGPVARVELWPRGASTVRKALADGALPKDIACPAQ